MAPPARAGAVAAVAVSVGFLVVRDGSLGWQAGRLVLVAALGWAALRWRERWGVRLAVGAVSLAVGVGIAVPHLSKDGLSLAAVAGIVAVGAGVVLLVDVVRTARHRWRRGAGAIVTAALALYCVGQPVAATNVPRVELGSRTPSDVGLAYTDVEVRTSGDVRLSGWYVRPSSSSGAALVLLHGAGSTRASVLPHAAVLARHGYGLLLLDARGHGGSRGRAMDFGWYGDRDVDAALTFLAGQPEVDPGRLALVGMSMGGEEVIGAAAGDGRVRAVVAEGATGRVAADKAWLSDEFGLRGAAQEVLSLVMYGVTDVLTWASPPPSLRSAVASSPDVPMLLITAGDLADERRVALRLQDASPAVDVWTVPNTGHTDALATSPEAWEERVTEFLSAALRR